MPVCKFNKCNKNSDSFDFCYEHRCHSLFYCTNPVYKDLSICENHKCQVTGCNCGIYKQKGKYCRKHSCVNIDCYNLKMGVSLKCQNCRNKLRETNQNS